jgi:succinyl-CoA synthetase beta subunit
MLGNRLVTKQSGAEGKPVHKVLITERLYLRRETYFAILMDRQFGGPVMVASSKGGMNIEDVAASTPEAIFKEPIEMLRGVGDEQIERLAHCMGFRSENSLKQVWRGARCVRAAACASLC